MELEEDVAIDALPLATKPTPIGRIVGIKSFIRLFGITVALIKVSATQEERSKVSKGFESPNLQGRVNSPGSSIFIEPLVKMNIHGNSSSRVGLALLVVMASMSISGFLGSAPDIRLEMAFNIVSILLVTSLLLENGLRLNMGLELVRLGVKRLFENFRVIPLTSRFIGTRDDIQQMACSGIFQAILSIGGDTGRSHTSRGRVPYNNAQGFCGVSVTKLIPRADLVNGSSCDEIDHGISLRSFAVLPGGNN
ncbi:hypothetical protein Tco_0336389 [Tanacetum coccineum]